MSCDTSSWDVLYLRAQTREGMHATWHWKPNILSFPPPRGEVCLGCPANQRKCSCNSH
ncbi:hypothetical protein GBAR_LOCUS466 [Geodia barretti]|uniref:Uncharacterized protein n=1 Tax=Geodia barretti TaxID=519541 RepID=A0AA35QSI6_GEOBA|nr:hypothetical protein GBAR_LOCUS466 [Geodia barretti]